ncbi:hypothetical protein HN615_06555 [Candidatus Woesearchaeota archaeon]|jgi:hypothetical protein|nr:hypothetical protein [Candidatus Woesearchaeota archaeon]
MERYFKWARNVLISTCIISLSIVGFNYYVDAFNLFNKPNANMAQDLHNGYYITGNNISSNRVDNIYEPLIRKIKNNIDILAIGSSRTMLLHRDTLFGKDELEYYNFTDGTARLKHYAKILGLLNKYNIKFPHTVILGLDPWIFDEKASLSQIKQLLNNYSDNEFNYLQLFNYEYTKINILSLINQKKYSKSKKLQDLRNSKNVIISTDGDMYYPEHINNTSTDKLVENVKEGLKDCDENNSNTKCVKYNKLNNFPEVKYLLNYLKEKNVNIVVYLAPFEPTFYEHIAKYNNFTKHNNNIVSFFRKNHIKIIGSYNPDDLNLSSDYFLDGIHLNQNGINSIFKDIQLDKYISGN